MLAHHVPGNRLGAHESRGVQNCKSKLSVADSMLVIKRFNILLWDAFVLLRALIETGSAAALSTVLILR